MSAPRLTLAALVASCALVAGCGTYLDRDDVAAGRAGDAGATPGAASAGVAAGDDLGTTDAGGPGDAVGVGGAGSPGSPTAGRPGGDGTAAAAGATGAAATVDAAGSGAEPVYDDGVSDDEIKIGFTGPLSGVIGFLGEEVVASIDSMAKLTNERGGIGGRTIRLISYDDRLDPSLTLANAKRLIEQDKVFMLFAIFSDSALSYVDQKKVPLITFGVTAPPFSSKYPTVIPLVGNAFKWNQTSAYAVVNHMNIKPKRVAVLYDTTLFDERGYLKYFRETWERLGAEVVSMDPMNLSDGDCSSLALKMRSLDVEYWDFEGLGWLLCISAMERIGWKPSLGMGGWTTSVAEVGRVVGPSVAGLVSGSQADQPDGAPRQRTKAHEDYAAAVARYHPKLNTFGHLESPAMTGYWVGMRLFVDGMKAIAPTFTRAALLEWLHGVKDYDVGIQPPIKSLAPDCKRGSGEEWWARWQWDDANDQAFRKPESPYIGSLWAEDYGGECYLTKVADEIVG